MTSCSLSYSMATKIRTELSRDPPSHFKSKVPLCDDQVAERKAKLVAYDASKKRQQTSKFGRLLAATEDTKAAVREEGGATREAISKTEQSIKEHVTAELQRLQTLPGSSSQSSTFPVGHAAIHTNLQRGGFTSAQLLTLHKAANLSPPMRANANDRLVPEKAKYQLAQSLCSAAGSGQHVVDCPGVTGGRGQDTGHIFDYATLGAWMEALRNGRPLVEWMPPVHSPMTDPPSSKKRRKGGLGSARNLKLTDLWAHSTTIGRSTIPIASKIGRASCRERV